MDRGFGEAAVFIRHRIVTPFPSTTKALTRWKSILSDARQYSIFCGKNNFIFFIFFTIYSILSDVGMDLTVL